MHGTQSQLHFLRVRHTDFIFSVFAEEFGFVGCAVADRRCSRHHDSCVMFRIALPKPRMPIFGRVLAAGCNVPWSLMQAFINIGMNANLLPVTGLPLPLG